MDLIYYHSKDLDGLTSGAIAHFVFNTTLRGYDYGEKFKIDDHSKKEVMMVDVSLKMPDMFNLAKKSKEFIWVDHHVSAFNDFVKVVEKENYDCRQSAISGTVTEYFIPKFNFYYYYSPILSACEIMLQVYGAVIVPRNAHAAVKLLGQYDTWRDKKEKMVGYDSDWRSKVLPFQWAMRSFTGVYEVIGALREMDEVGIKALINVGLKILEYQASINVKIMEKNSFVFKYRDIRFIAANTPYANSMSFESHYNEFFHDAMMPFSFNAKTGKWDFSMYSIKEDVDVLSIAKDFGGGGHKQACGFSRYPDEVVITREGISFSEIFMIDVAAIPKDFDPIKLKALLAEQGAQIISSEKKENVVFKQDLSSPDIVTEIPRNIKTLQDHDGDWYWIPNVINKKFNEALKKIEGKEYMDCPDDFDAFNEKYGKYATGGDQYLKPEHFKKK